MYASGANNQTSSGFGQHVEECSHFPDIMKACSYYCENAVQYLQIVYLSKSRHKGDHKKIGLGLGLSAKVKNYYDDCSTLCSSQLVTDLLVFDLNDSFSMAMPGSSF